MVSWLRRHDGEIFLLFLSISLRTGAWFTNPDDHPFLYPTLHGMADDAAGGLFILIVAKYLWERVSD